MENNTNELVDLTPECRECKVTAEESQSCTGCSAYQEHQSGKKRYYALLRISLDMIDGYAKNIERAIRIAKDKDLPKDFRDYTYELYADDLRREIKRIACKLREDGNPDEYLENAYDNYLSYALAKDNPKEVSVIFFNKKKEGKGCIPIQYDEELKKLYIEM